MRPYLGCSGELVRVKGFHGAVNGSRQPAQDPLAAKGHLLRVKDPFWGLEAVPKIDHGKLDCIPQLVAPVPVGHHALDVQVDVPALQYTM